MRYKKGKSQGNLFDYHERMAVLAQRGGAMDRLNEVIDWSIFRVKLQKLAGHKFSPAGGRPPWEPVLMFKVLVLQKFHGLSDEQTELQILDRMSFQRFLGLDVGDDVPDATTIWLFKERLGDEGMRALFDIFDAYLREAGLIGREGKVIDASFVDMPRQRNSREENAQIKEGKRPESFDEHPPRARQKDTDGRWTSKGNERHFGYKNHCKADLDSKFVEDYTVTDASTHDSNVLEILIHESDKIMYADSAYKSAKIDDLLKENRIANQIHEKGYRNNPLSDAARQSNRTKSSLRVRVEHIFGRQAQMGCDWFRRHGIKRARFEIGLANLVYNLDRLRTLKCVA